MWRKESRARRGRGGPPYASDLTDAEWALVAPLIRPAERGGNKRAVDERAVVNGLTCIPSTGCQWQAISKDPPPRGPGEIADVTRVDHGDWQTSACEGRRLRSFKSAGGLRHDQSRSRFVSFGGELLQAFAVARDRQDLT